MEYFSRFLFVKYFPEAIPNTIDSAIKGNFKDDGGSYSDTFGKVAGGLIPAADVRDVIADGKRVADGEDGSYIKLGASIIGAIPIAGDIAKPIIKKLGKEILEKSAKEVEKEVAEKLIKEGIEKEVAEKVAKEEVEIAIKEAKAAQTTASGKLILESGRSLSVSEKEFADKMVAEGRILKARKEAIFKFYLITVY